jgi:hypothetical protein
VCGRYLLSNQVQSFQTQNDNRQQQTTTTTAITRKENEKKKHKTKLAESFYTCLLVCVFVYVCGFPVPFVACMYASMHASSVARFVRFPFTCVGIICVWLK